VSTIQELDLELGDLRFSALVHGEGPLVLFLHGFPDLPQTWQHQLQACADAGYRAVAVTLRGYETSSLSPTGDYHITALAADVIGWLDALEAERAHLVGHDWGAVVACAAAALRPERFRSLAVLAVPNSGRFLHAMQRSPRQLWLSRYMLFFQLRGVAEWTLRGNGLSFVDRLWRRWSPGWTYDPQLTRRVRERLAQPGILEAALAYYRQALQLRSQAGRAALRLAQRPIPVPCLALHGERDGCIAPAVFRACMRSEDFPNGVCLHTLKDAGHFLHLEAPAEVNALLLDWWRQHRD
jgi:pimeloyl-ACP methyl ester carboxylesterase